MSRKLDKSTIGIRAQEYHEGLKDIPAFGPREVHLENTLLVGKVASLATHLKGLDYVEDITALTYLAAELGISGTELRVVLTELEEVGFARVVKSGSRIKRVELRVPELRSGYEELGERWIQLAPGEIEQAAIHLLDDVASFPQSETAIRADLGLDEPIFNTLVALGKEGALVERHKAIDGETLLYSPLTIEEKPDSLIALSRKFPEERIIAALNEVQHQQGIPLEQVRVTDSDVIEEAVLLGVLCPVRVVAGENNPVFLFSPRGGLKKEERIILEKARAILACVRYGEHYAGVRKIKSPLRILQTLRDQKTFSTPRPDFPEQYGLLVTKQIGYVVPTLGRAGFFNFHLLDTPENMHALDIAIDILQMGQTSTSRLEVETRSFLDVAGSFSGTLPTRSRISRNVVISKEMNREIVTEIARLARGVIK